MGAQQQREVKLRLSLAHTKRNFDDWVQGFDVVSGLVTRDIEDQPVISRFQRRIFWQ
jgi:hypothetical protein